ncbi:MAG: hypothetical protein LBK95_11620, partial [Bifidobacteriaceae bacterium]|nr:hypothetical protein [Bifidobacteriaceae bacterium]
MSRSALTLKLTGALKRLPRAVVKPVALVAVGAVALGGLTLAQSWMSRDAAEAVTFLGGWGGAFDRNQLWLQDDANLTYPMYMAEDPGAVTSGSLPWVGSMDPWGTLSGAGVNNTTVENVGLTIAVGPVFKHADDATLHMVDQYFEPDSPVYVYRSHGGGLVGDVLMPQQVDALEYGTMADSVLAKDHNGTLAPSDACRSGERWSADINQASGYLYNMDMTPGHYFDGEVESIALPLAIYEMGLPPADGSGGTITCLAGTTSITSADPAHPSVTSQFMALSGDTNPSPVDRRWIVSSDMVTDSNGNIYVMLLSDSHSPGQATNKYVLLRINVPMDNYHGLPLSSATGAKWTYEVVQYFTGVNSGDDEMYSNDRALIVGMAFVDGYLYTAGNYDDPYRGGGGSHILKWDMLRGTVVSAGKVSPGRSFDVDKGVDLASAESVPVIRGTVYNDTYGSGVISSTFPGVGGVEVRLYEGNSPSGGSTTWTDRGARTTTSDGRYSFVLNSAVGEYLVRVVQPTIALDGSTGDRVNAVQTWGNAGSLCTDGANDYQPRTGRCWGARA